MSTKPAYLFITAFLVSLAPACGDDDDQEDGSCDEQACAACLDEAFSADGSDSTETLCEAECGPCEAESDSNCGTSTETGSGACAE